MHQPTEHMYWEERGLYVGDLHRKRRTQKIKDWSRDGWQLADGIDWAIKRYRKSRIKLGLAVIVDISLQVFLKWDGDIFERLKWVWNLGDIGCDTALRSDRGKKAKTCSYTDSGVMYSTKMKHENQDNSAPAAIPKPRRNHIVAFIKSDGFCQPGRKPVWQSQGTGFSLLMIADKTWRATAVKGQRWKKDGTPEKEGRAKASSVFIFLNQGWLLKQNPVETLL